MLNFTYYFLDRMDLYQTLNSLAPNCEFILDKNFLVLMVLSLLIYLLVYLGDNNLSNSDDVINDFPPSEEPVYILGRKYSSLYGLYSIQYILLYSFLNILVL